MIWGCNLTLSVWLCAFALAVGCGGSQQTPPGVYDSSANPAFVDLSSPLAVIGRDSVISGHAHYVVVGAFRAPDGRIVVADASTNEIRVFSSHGSLVRRIAASGADDLNFASLNAVWYVPPDSVVGFDILRRRLAYWTMDGAFGREVVLRAEAVGAVVARLKDGSYLGVVKPVFRRFDAGTSRLDSVRLVRLNGDGTSGHTIRVVPWETLHARKHPLQNRTMYTGSPFDPRGLIAADSTHVYYAYPSEPQIERFDANGTADLIVPLEPPESLHDTTWVAWIRAQSERATRRNRGELRRLLAGLPRPTFRPAIDRLFVDDQGMIWYRRFVAPGANRAQWHIRDTLGVLRATLDVPIDFRPLHAGPGYLVAATLTGSGHEIVTVYRSRSLAAEADAR